MKLRRLFVVAVLGVSLIGGVLLQQKARAAGEDFTMTPSLNLDENMYAGFIDVVLAVAPTSDVVIDFSSSDVGEVTIENGGTLVFTPGDWNVPQQVEVRTVNDDWVRTDSASIIGVINDALSDDAYDPVANKSTSISINPSST